LIKSIFEIQADNQQFWKQQVNLTILDHILI